MSGEKIASRSQLLHLAGMLAQSIPPDLPADVAQRWVNNPDVLRRAVREVLFIPKSAWQILLDACQVWVNNPDFNEANFPLGPIAVDGSEWEIHEHHFSETVTGEEAFRKLEEMGFRLLGGSRRGMQFVAEHPDIQLDHPLVLTVCWQDPDPDDGYRKVPVFSSRNLFLRWFDREFSPIHGWLVLRRKQA